jgi:hypothetical protein
MSKSKHEIIEKIVKVDNIQLGYEIHTNKQVITCFIGNVSGCCENWGFITTEDTIQDFIGAKLLGINLIDMDYKTHPLTYDMEYGDEGGFCFVDILTSKGTLQFALYNLHNGYYGHTVEITSNQLAHSMTL